MISMILTDVYGMSDLCLGIKRDAMNIVRAVLAKNINSATAQ